jgi:signal transduction histidine kinase/DNA-binding response OmpR family regulator
MSDRVNILVVDDLADKRLAFQAVLEELEQNLVLVTSGAEALGELLRQEFAVIVLDVNMPDIDGIETAELIRRHGKTAHTPIIFVTAYADEMQTARGYALGAVDYILTPVVPEILRSKVRVFVDLYRAQRRAQDLVRAEADRAAAEDGKRRSEFIALVSRELAATLDIEQTMRRFLDMLVPALADLAVLSVRNGDEDIVLVRNQTKVATTRLERLPRPVRRAVDEAARDGWQLHVRVRSADTPDWPPDLHSAHVVPLKVADRNIGVLVLAVAAPALNPPEDGTLNEIVSRAAIAFDNAALYNSLKREMARSKEAEEKLQEASRRKDEFLAMLSHELRNPLAPILSASEVMRKVAPADPAIRWARDVVERQVTHLAQLVDDLLDVSRITQGKITLIKEPVALDKVIQHSVETAMGLLDAKRHCLSVDVPPTPVWVHGDFARLSQIFGNLLNNAAKYTADGGRLEIQVAAERGEAIVTVRDNGIGIEPQFLPHVFEVFTQGDQSLDRSQGGLGVGLTVVRRLVELHQGRVEISSDGAGTGTEVRVALPCVSEVKQAGETATRDEPDQDDSSGKRVLVVDDNVDAAESIAVFLRLEGHEVKTVGDGPQALACLPVFAPHVALVDIGLPGMDGYEVARSMARSASGVPELMIALTGYGQTEDFARSQAAGFHHHFVKPADPREIQAVIAHAQPGAAGSSSAAAKSSKS